MSTDTETPLIQGPLQPEVSNTLPTEVPNPTYPCKGCDKVFDNATALAVHARVHLDREPCPECGAKYLPGPGMSAHRKAKHGVIPRGSIVSGRALPATKYKGKRKVCPECSRELSAKDMSRHLRESHGVETNSKMGRPRKNAVVTPLRSHRNEEWAVDDIFNSVVSIMWPRGEMPVSALAALIEWREATAKMLLEVSR